MIAKIIIGTKEEVEKGLNDLFEEIEKYRRTPEIETIKYAMTDNIISALVVFKQPIGWMED